MTLKQAIEIANKYQLWRKGVINDCPVIADITVALDNGNGGVL